jgi:hypothetical protein
VDVVVGVVITLVVDIVDDRVVVVVGVVGISKGKT